MKRHLAQSEPWGGFQYTLCGVLTSAKDRRRGKYDVIQPAEFSKLVGMGHICLTCKAHPHLALWEIASVTI